MVWQVRTTDGEQLMANQLAMDKVQSIKSLATGMSQRRIAKTLGITPQGAVLRHLSRFRQRDTVPPSACPLSGGESPKDTGCAAHRPRVPELWAAPAGKWLQKPCGRTARQLWPSSNRASTAMRASTRRQEHGFPASTVRCALREALGSSRAEGTVPPHRGRAGLRDASGLRSTGTANHGREGKLHRRLTSVRC